MTSFYIFLGLFVAFMVGLIIGVRIPDPRMNEKIQTIIDKVKKIDPDPNYPPKTGKEKK